MSAGSPQELERVLGGAPSTLVVVGAGGLGVMTLDVLRAADPDAAVVLVDDASERIGSQLHGARVYGPVDACLGVAASAGAGCVAAIAANAVRERIVSRHAQLRYVNAVHPRATVSPLASIGAGCIVLPGTAVDPQARIGNHVVINKLCSIGHNCVLEDFAQLAPLVGSGGHHEARSFVGMAASVLPLVRVGADSVVGAGSVVTADVPEGVTVVGAPARPRQARGGD